MSISKSLALQHTPTRTRPEYQKNRLKIRGEKAEKHKRRWRGGHLIENWPGVRPTKDLRTGRKRKNEEVDLRTKKILDASKPKITHLTRYGKKIYRKKNFRRTRF